MEKTTQPTQHKLIKVVFYGPESSGKTTLAEKMAKDYNTKWVPEYARRYLQKKYDSLGKSSEVKDIMPIAYGQVKLEKEIEKEANNYLFYDTNLLENYVYAKTYFPKHDFSELKVFFETLKYDYYFLTYIDTPWIPDNLRDKPTEREEMFLTFEKYLKIFNKDYTILRGNLIERIKTVNSIINSNQNL